MLNKELKILLLEILLQLSNVLNHTIIISILAQRDFLLLELQSE